jgi:Cof subfamily protein (haloacid dehalogenase superfamily)
VPDARFPIRLLALDLDGTLVGEDLLLRERTRLAVAGAVRRGVHVAIVTGRMATSARPFADALGLDGPLIAYQGALIRQMPGPGERLGRLLVHRPLPADVARDAVAWCFANGFRPHANHLERFIVAADDPNADDYSKFIGARAELVPDLRSWIRQPLTKIIAVGEEGRPATLLDDAQALFRGRAAVMVSHPRYIEFLAAGVSKGRAVRWLARRLGVPAEQAMAIGDQHNDLEMLAEVGHGVAMAGAPAGVQAAARYLAQPLAEEGAAQVIEALVLAGRASRRNVVHFLPTPGATDARDDAGS